MNFETIGFFDDLEIITENDLQKTFDRATTQTRLSPRCWALWRLIEHNSLVEHRKTSQREICDKLFDYGYKWDNDEKVHDHCSMIWTDIKDNNESYEHEKIIISKDFNYWIGNDEETREFIDNLWKALYPRLCRYWNYDKKHKRNGQGKMLSTQLEPIDDESKARRFVESYGETRIS